MGNQKHNAKKHARRFEETMYFHEAALTGHTYAQIASLASSRFGRTIGHELVRRRLKEYRDARVVESVEELRWKEVDRLDRYLVALDKTILAPAETVVGDDGTVLNVDPFHDERVKSITTAVRIADRRARLLGLDAPVQAEVVVTNVAPIDLEMEALAAEVAERNNEAEVEAE